MQRAAKYVIFRTKWGYFGLAGTELGLCRIYLPRPKAGIIESLLLKNLPGARFDRTLFKTLQGQIIAYFEGSRVNFGSDIPLLLNGMTGFSHLVLNTCRNIEFGRTISYAALASESVRPAASRAVGGALARNPLPLIIPCHRVIRSDGKLGGFSSPGGIKLKQRMLDLERQASKA
jgi:methylated-DNA-[protein]-cysteine S-methyltransferase